MPEERVPRVEDTRFPAGLSMAPGTRLGTYEIVRPIGAGGMGEVYLARDARLKRDVALKILPDRYHFHNERLARFEREAQLLAALNHPNIATIHGLESTADTLALVMEFVDGETLADKLLLGGLPVATVLPIARQLVEALDAAHEQGIVHRDLKPANIKVRPDGMIKVLDFGIAKALDVDNAAVAVEVTTLTAADRAIVGTPAYMSPEQARGSRVDRRTDIWAFGCVLYEMITGRRAFDGATTSDAIASVLTREPDWAGLPRDVPSGVGRLLQRCLEKDTKQRLRDIADAREHLHDALHASTDPAGASPAVRCAPMARLAWIAAAVALIVALGIPAAVHLREAPPPELRLQIATPPTTVPQQFALSPDGRYIVFVASGSSSDAAQRLYLRALDNTVAQPMAGTDGARYPFWSPDSRSIGFFAAEELFRIDISGGPPQALAAAAFPQGGAWNADGTILFAPNTVSALMRVPASGGTSRAATQLDEPRHKSHRFPSFLPDGRRFLFHAEGEPEVSGIYLGSLDGGPSKRLAPVASAPAYLPPDRVVFAQQGAVVAQRLDISRGELTGDPVTLTGSIGADASAAVGFSISGTGVVAYRAGGGAPLRTSWVDRTGKVLGQLAGLNAPELSPDGRYVAGDRTLDGNRDVWLLDLVRGASTRFTTHQAVDGFPVWSPDGSRIAFHSQRNGTFDVWIKRLNGAVGTEELLVGTPDNEWPLDWSRDGRFLLYHRSDQNYVSSDLWVLPMTGSNREPIVVANTPFDERLGQFSPDGRWIAYETNESGRREIVLQAFPESSAPVHISTSGGVAPRWSADGKEIYFVAPDGKMMAVRVAVKGSTLTLGDPAALFSPGLPAQVFKVQYAVTRDGQFLVNGLMEEGTASPITLILNWKPSS